MLRSLYSGISGMRNFQVKLDVIGNNIANVNTVGFKGGRVMFSDILGQAVAGATTPSGAQGGVNPKQIGLGATVSSIDTVHSTGSAMTTNLATDLMINGNGFFAVSKTPPTAVDISTLTDSVFLTRAGNFTKDANGDLVTPEGFFVLDNAGEKITIPTDKSFSISQTGEVMIEGAAAGTNQFIGLVNVPNPGGLNKVGSTFFQLTSNAADLASAVDIVDATTGGTGEIISGRLEMSNVDLTSEFTEMIVAQRGFQANSRIITTSDSILEEVVNLKR